MIVFTQYDMLVKITEKRLRRRDKALTSETAAQLAMQEASKVLDGCVRSAERSMEKLNIPLVKHAKVSSTSAQFYDIQYNTDHV